MSKLQFISNFFFIDSVVIGNLNLDFDMATTDGSQHRGNTDKFASSGFFRNQDRYAMDDLESLIFSMWDIAGVPLVGNKPYGRTLSEYTKKQDAEAKVKVCQEILSFD